MITLTESAAARIKNLMTRREAMVGLRVGVRGGGCSGFSYFFAPVDIPGETDKTIESLCVNLYVDPKSYLYLMGTEIDFVDDLNQTGFKFNNPTAKRTCSCGESFSV